MTESVTVTHTIVVGDLPPEDLDLMRETRKELIGAGNVKDGVCGDCGNVIEVGMWPFSCAGRGHIIYQRLAIFGGGRSKDYAPPTPINPITEPVITRDWMNPDGTTRPMARDEWDKRNVTYIEGKS